MSAPQFVFPRKENEKRSICETPFVVDFRQFGACNFHFFSWNLHITVVEILICMMYGDDANDNSPTDCSKQSSITDCEKICFRHEFFSRCVFFCRLIDDDVNFFHALFDQRYYWFQLYTICVLLFHLVSMMTVEISKTDPNPTIDFNYLEHNIIV